MAQRIYTRYRYKYTDRVDAFSLDPDVYHEFVSRWKSVIENKSDAKVMTVGYWQVGTYTEREFDLSNIAWIEESKSKPSSSKKGQSKKPPSRKKP